MAQSKATKKFEKHHLKGTLEKRNNLKKTKQLQQLKARKKARRVEENGGEQEQAKPAKTTVAEALNDMTVDEFFQGGFEIPELPKSKNKSDGKRKRSEVEDEDAQSDSDVPFEQAPVNGENDDSDSEMDSDDYDDHKDQLDALAKNDPEFHKYLKENEPELLDASIAEIGDVSDDETPKRKKQKKSQDDDEDSDSDMEAEGNNELDMATVKKWETALIEQHSLRATKELVLAFRAAAHVAEDDDKEFKYSISDPQVYHQLLTVALKRIPAVFDHHLPVQQTKGGKFHVSTESKKFKTLAPILRSQITSIIHLLENLSDPATLRTTLTSALPLLPYLLSFKKLVRDVSRAATAVWSSASSTEATRIAAFLVVRRLTVIGDAGIRENVLKTVYQGLVKGSRNTTIHTQPAVNLMKNSAAELWGLADSAVAYTTGFTFIRQLAIHLRTSITHNSNESYKTVYNWQYVHSLDFWSRVLSSHATDADSPLKQLIYPLVQVTLGALRLIPTATYFPLRFQLIRSLLRLSLATGTYIPLAPALYEVLNSAEMRKSPKASTAKPLDFATSIRASKTYLRTRIYQDGVGEQVAELLSEFFVLWAKNVAFPELSLPVIIMLKRWLKEANNRAKGTGNKNQKVNGQILLVVQKLEANSRFIEEKRARVDFAPNNRRAVSEFLSDLAWQKTPLGAYVSTQRKIRDDRAKVVEQGRKEEERKREADKKKSEEERNGAGEVDGFEAEDEDDESAEEDQSDASDENLEDSAIESESSIDDVVIDGEGSDLE